VISRLRKLWYRLRPVTYEQIVRAANTVSREATCRTTEQMLDVFLETPRGKMMYASYVRGLKDRQARGLSEPAWHYPVHTDVTEVSESDLRRVMDFVRMSSALPDRMFFVHREDWIKFARDAGQNTSWASKYWNDNAVNGMLTMEFGGTQ